MANELLAKVATTTELAHANLGQKAHLCENVR